MVDSNRDDYGEVTRLLLAYRADLYAYIYVCVRNHSDTEDILQDVAVAVVKSFELRGTNDEQFFRKWALTAARNRVLEHQRKKKSLRVDSNLVTKLAEAAERVQERHDESRRMSALKSCLESFSPKIQKIFEMRYGRPRQDCHQIARWLNRSLQATHGLLKRSRLKLRECIEQKMAEESS